MSKKSFLRLAGLALAALLAAATAAAQKKTLAVVVKGLDNPFFTVLGDGCKKWNNENASSEYTCSTSLWFSSAASMVVW